jgi:hypothetical protein
LVPIYTSTRLYNPPDQHRHNCSGQPNENNLLHFLCVQDRLSH